jgi:two-component system chemotaxis response regulator CheY
MRILLVDDSKTMRSIQKAVLSQLGYTDVAEACDGQEALNKIPECKPDLMLVDWNMPVMDGLTFVKTYRATISKTTPIIMVTTEAEKARVIEAIKAGVNNYVVKPFTPDLLGQRISETLLKAGALKTSDSSTRAMGE